MKLNRIILPAVAATMLLTGCDDMKMEWGTPEGHGSVTAEDIPLAVKEVLANYGTLKEYSAQYMPNSILGLGFGVDKYITVDETDPYRTLPNENYQMFTPGNAMKMGVMVSNSGAINFETVDKMLETMPSDMKLYGHNFIWHTQQQQTYLKSLIAPDVQVVVDPGDVCENIISNYTFDENFNGWMSWSNHTKTIESPGKVGDGCALFEVTSASSAQWSDQLFYDLGTPLAVGETYAYQYWAKTNVPGTKIQFLTSNSSSNVQDYGKENNELTSTWVKYTGELTISKEDQTRVGAQFGGGEAKIWIDDFKFGKKIENTDPDAHRTNLLKNGDFASDIAGWDKWNGTDGCNTWNADEGNKAKGCLQVVNDMNEAGNQWKLQIHGSLVSPIKAGSHAYISFYAKTAKGNGSLRCSTTGDTHYQGDKTITSDWQRIEWDFDVTSDDGLTGLNFDMAAVENTYYIDDVVISTEPFTEETTSTNAKGRAATRASQTITYVVKTADEKREALLGAMDSWIKGVADHLKEKGVTPYGYDVINEPIEDKTGKPRGVKQDDGSLVFNGTDTEPVETTEEGLTLNWASDTGNKHFYWGYYVPDYAVQAFSKARQYLPTDTKLFVNDYGLESSTTKLQGFIDFVTKIDADYKALGHTDNVVDGVGTQMHLNINVTDDTDHNAEVIAEWKTKIDNMFQKLAATGKLVRVTEFDIAINAKSPSAAQYKAQADAYKMVFESYKANVPADQQSGITIWSLSDAEDEHEYWLNGDHPNLFDANYKRKWAYKGVCDGIAGEDLGLKYGGDAYKAYYEKSNVSETVK